jgi:hypothetical protein
MTDVMELLQEELNMVKRAKFCDEETIAEQADEIERLRAENKQLVEDHHRMYGAALLKLDRLEDEIERSRNDFDAFRRSVRIY